MAGKKKHVSLYELIGERGVRTSDQGSANGRPARPAPRPEPKPVAVEAPDRAPIAVGPGRTVRVPVGYVFCAVALMVFIAVGSFVLGYKKAERAAERQRQEQQARIRLDDPLNEDGAGGDLIADGSAANPRDVSRAGSDTPGSSPGPVNLGSPDRMVVVESGARDPRQAGMNYLNLALLPRGEAERLGRFLSANGVEIGVVARGKHFQVVALRPFAAGELYKSGYEAFVRDLRQLGKRYESQEDGATDLSDLYPEKHAG